MKSEEARLGEARGAYIGPGVVFKGDISGTDEIIVEGVVEGDITATTVCIGEAGIVKGNVVANDADVHGTLSNNAEIKQFLLLRSTGRVEGHITCGDLQVERGAVIAGDFSVGNSVAQGETPEREPAPQMQAQPVRRPAPTVRLEAAE
jgi:cytoskeletal protein CcmA (bactofilin family)